MTAGAFWMDCLMKAMSCFCSTIVLVMILSAALPVSVERMNVISEYVAVGLVILWCIPIARNTRYRLRDAGYTKKAYLWLLLPVIGWIVFIVLLCAKSTPVAANDSDHFIDTWEC